MRGGAGGGDLKWAEVHTSLSTSSGCVAAIHSLDSPSISSSSPAIAAEPYCRVRAWASRRRSMRSAFFPTVDSPIVLQISLSSWTCWCGSAALVSSSCCGALRVRRGKWIGGRTRDEGRRAWGAAASAANSGPSSSCTVEIAGTGANLHLLEVHLVEHLRFAIYSLDRREGIGPVDGPPRPEAKICPFATMLRVPKASAAKARDVGQGARLPAAALARAEASSIRDPQPRRRK